MKFSKYSLSRGKAAWRCRDAPPAVIGRGPFEGLTESPQALAAERAEHVRTLKSLDREAIALAQINSTSPSAAGIDLF